jgi:hypothetical protein
MKPRNRLVGIDPFSLCSLVDSILWNLFLGSLNVYKAGLWILKDCVNFFPPSGTHLLNTFSPERRIRKDVKNNNDLSYV